MRPLAFACIAGAVSVLGQVDTGGILGRVNDETGAVVPGVQTPLVTNIWVTELVK